MKRFWKLSLITFLTVLLPAQAILPTGKVFYKALEKINQTEEDKQRDSDKTSSKIQKISISKNVIKEFYKNGSPKLIININKNQLHGKATRFHKNGQIAEETFFTNNVLNGSYKGFTKTGSPTYTYNFKNGSLNGRQVTYYRNGIQELETNYLNGLRNGEMKKFTKRGQLASSKLFELGDRKLRPGEKSVGRKFGEIAAASVLIAGAAVGAAAVAANSGGGYYQATQHQCNHSLQGCCSYHGGIRAAYPGTRVLCNDGTYSPTCYCSY
jgi:hypothetical protein